MDHETSNLVQSYLYTFIHDAENINRCVVVFNEMTAVSYKHSAAGTSVIFKKGDSFILQNVVDSRIKIQV